MSAPLKSIFRSAFGYAPRGSVAFSSPPGSLNGIALQTSGGGGTSGSIDASGGSSTTRECHHPAPTPSDITLPSDSQSELECFHVNPNKPTTISAATNNNNSEEAGTTPLAAKEWKALRLSFNRAIELMEQHVASYRHRTSEPSVDQIQQQQSLLEAAFNTFVEELITVVVDASGSSVPPASFPAKRGSEPRQSPTPSTNNTLARVKQFLSQMVMLAATAAQFGGVGGSRTIPSGSISSGSSGCVRTPVNHMDHFVPGCGGGSPSRLLPSPMLHRSTSNNASPKISGAVRPRGSSVSFAFPPLLLGDDTHEHAACLTARADSPPSATRRPSMHRSSVSSTAGGQHLCIFVPRPPAHPLEKTMRPDEGPFMGSPRGRPRLESVIQPRRPSNDSGGRSSSGSRESPAADGSLASHAERRDMLTVNALLMASTSVTTPIIMLRSGHEFDGGAVTRPAPADSGPVSSQGVPGVVIASNASKVAIRGSISTGSTGSSSHGSISISNGSMVAAPAEALHSIGATPNSPNQSGQRSQDSTLQQMMSTTSQQQRRAPPTTISVTTCDGEDGAAPAETTYPYGDFLKDFPCYTVNQYALLDNIGKGTQGEVFCCLDMQTGQQRAIKVIPRPVHLLGPVAGLRKNVESSRKMHQLEREVAIMKRCRHRNILGLYEVIDDPQHDELYLVMQLAKGALMQIMSTGDATAKFSINDVVRFGQQLCSGLKYLHDRGIVHRDIKPANILVGDDDSVMLGDFGISGMMQQQRAANIPSASGGGVTMLSTNTNGTPAFLCPERLRRQSNDATSPPPPCHDDYDSQFVAQKKADVWALGMTLYVARYGRLPWPLNVPLEVFVHSVLEVPIAFDAPKGKVSGGSPRMSYTTSSSDPAATAGDAPERKNRRPGVPDKSEALDSVLQEMLQRDPDRRWNVTRCLRAFEQIEHSLEDEDIQNMRRVSIMEPDAGSYEAEEEEEVGGITNGGC